APILALGGHLKNTVAVAVGEQAVISQHLGDLETAEARASFRAAVGDLRALYQLKPAVIACDPHPDYYATVEAKGAGRLLVPVQHHHAHVAACMAEHELRGPVLGVAWDGAGYGPDGTIWGGEFLLADEHVFQRVATFRRFRLPGGERAVKEPRRAALGLLYEMWGDALFAREGLPPANAFPPSERALLGQILQRAVNSPMTSSVGRLFDAVASLIDLRHRTSFEGQAAMALEFAVEGLHGDSYPFRITDGPVGAIRESPLRIIDWEPMIRNILGDARGGLAVGAIAAKFHHALAEIIVAIAGRAGRERVILTGGCFQNRYLTERAVRRLRAEGFRPYWHQRVPSNDGGLSLGQLYVAAGWQRLRVESG
ncbi:MAG: carbamoyltransferase HypF, partial [Nitrospirota bacterium]